MADLSNRSIKDDLEAAVYKLIAEKSSQQGLASVLTEGDLAFW